MTKPEASGAKMTACTGENSDKMVKTHVENSDLYLSVSFMRHPDAFLHLNPCGCSQRMSNTLSSIFSLTHSDSERRLAKGLILCLRLQEILFILHA